MGQTKSEKESKAEYQRNRQQRMLRESRLYTILEALCEAHGHQDLIEAARKQLELYERSL